jgi:N-acetylmuramoyl-L-alanine amidase
MSFFSKRQIPLLLITAILLVVLCVALYKRESTTPSTPVETRPSTTLSILAAPPDWAALEIFQETLTRSEFERLLTTVFTTGDAWRKVIEMDEMEARIQKGSSPDGEFFHLHFATSGTAARPPRYWRPASELPPTDPSKPLSDLHIAIDPGHIGGDWAKMEERWFVVEDGSPVCEGNMTLHVARLLKPKLEALGAKISLVRDQPAPVTPIRPEALNSLARESSTPEDSPAALLKLAERLFYRTAEIRARAILVNQSLKPDLVLCLHFNAEPWGNPNQPTLVSQSHLHLLVNGAYNDEEVQLADQRFALLQKLLQRSHEEEVRIGSTVANIFAEISGLPPYRYPSDSPNARPVANHPYLWARNLLANRLYECPVIFMEPYVMNSTLDHARIQAGDYQGTRVIDGKTLPSIFQEYATGLADGLAKHYLQTRRMENPPPEDNR